LDRINKANLVAADKRVPANRIFLVNKIFLPGTEHANFLLNIYHDPGDHFLGQQFRIQVNEHPFLLLDSFQNREIVYYSLMSFL